MINTKYIFHSTCFDKEELRMKISLLEENKFDFKIIQNSVKTFFRSPLGGYFEAEVHIAERDFARADKVLAREF